MSEAENQPNMSPAPAAEQAIVMPGQSPEAAANTPEQAPAAAPESAPNASQAMPAIIPLPVPQAPISGAQTDVSITTQAATPAVADDGDLIEKEWVNKAKKIVEDNRDDPFTQSEELTVVKADYMQKRYNKTIKLNK